MKRGEEYQEVEDIWLKTGLSVVICLDVPLSKIPGSGLMQIKSECDSL